jgi:hypothetical protein
MINEFTKQFHDSTFPDFCVDQTLNQVLNNFWQNTCIPYVGIDVGFDTAATYKWLLDNDHLFAKTQSGMFTEKKNKDLGFEWFTSSHSEGWANLPVIGTTEKYKAIVPGDGAVTYQITHDVLPNSVPDLQFFLNQIGLSISELNIFRLKPGGFLQPHMDIGVDCESTMTYIWIPLHDFPPCLKIYPSGYLRHCKGNFYILNASNFMHSVVNTTDQPRYVATVFFDHKKIPQSFWNQIKQSLTQQWFT